MFKVLSRSFVLLPLLGGLALTACGQEPEAAGEAPPPADGVMPTNMEDHLKELQLVQAALALNPGDPSARQRARELNEHMDRQATYRMVSKAGTKVDFFVGPEGDAIIVETYADGADDPSAIPSNPQKPATLSEVFQQLRPGEPIPGELLAADARRGRDQPRNTPQLDVSLPSQRHGTLNKHGGGSCFHFVHEHSGACFVPADGDHNWCLCDLTGDLPGGSNHWAGAIDITSTIHHFALSAGDNISLSVRVFGGTSSTDSIWQYIVFSGERKRVTTRSARNSSGSYIRRQHMARTLNGVGDVYHWSACFDKETNSADWDCPEIWL